MISSVFYSVAFALGMVGTQSSSSGGAFAHYKNLPEARIETGIFNPAKLSRSEEFRIAEDCDRALLAEKRKLVSMGVTKFLDQPATCIKIVFSEEAAVYGASLVFLHDQQ